MIRRYSKSDKTDVIKLLRKNTPHFFDSSEEVSFINYLENELEDYFVYEKDSKIIGAGGINYFINQKFTRFSWDMVDPDIHNSGIGKELVQFRVNYVNKNPDIDFIEVRTSQHAYKFYMKMGFVIKGIEEKFWTDQFDLYQMRMKTRINLQIVKSKKSP